MAAKSPENTFTLDVYGRRLQVAGDPAGIMAGTDTAAILVDGKVMATQRALIIWVAAGLNGAGAVTVTGTAVGDKVIAVKNLTTPGQAESSFETTVSVANQVQQTNGSSLSTSNFLFVVEPQS